MKELDTLVKALQDLGWDTKQYHTYLRKLDKIESKIHFREEESIEVFDADETTVQFACDVLQLLYFRIEDKL